MERTDDLAVLVAGAGRVGLVVASEPAQAGVRATIIDRRNRVMRHSKANALWPRHRAQT